MRDIYVVNHNYDKDQIKKAQNVYTLVMIINGFGCMYADYFWDWHHHLLYAAGNVWMLWRIARDSRAWGCIDSLLAAITASGGERFNSQHTKETAFITTTKWRHSNTTSISLGYNTENQDLCSFVLIHSQRPH